jgi:hypothetical protein
VIVSTASSVVSDENTENHAVVATTEAAGQSVTITEANRFVNK